MNITILCDQTDCTFNEPYPIRHEYLQSSMSKSTFLLIHKTHICTHPQPVFLSQSEHSTCISKSKQVVDHAATDVTPLAPDKWWCYMCKVHLDVRNKEEIEYHVNKFHSKSDGTNN